MSLFAWRHLWINPADIAKYCINVNKKILSCCFFMVRLSKWTYSESCLLYAKVLMVMVIDVPSIATRWYFPLKTQNLKTVTSIPILMVASKQPTLRLLKWRLMQGPSGLPMASLNWKQKHYNQQLEFSSHFYFPFMPNLQDSMFQLDRFSEVFLLHLWLQ